ncbi:MAG: GtrA family protein [Clostridia bacterium]
MIKELLKRYKGIILYLVFGVMTTVINVISYHIAYDKLHIINVVSTVIAWVIAVTFAFVTNKLFVFESKKKNKEALGEAVNFFLCRIGTGVIEVGMMWLLVDIFHFNGTYMKLFTNVIVIIINYVLSKFIVFRGGKNVQK